MIYVPSWSKLHLKHRNYIKTLLPSEITERNRHKGVPSGEAGAFNI